MLIFFLIVVITNPHGGWMLFVNDVRELGQCLNISADQIFFLSEF